MAGASTSASGQLPWSRSTVSQALKAAGTVAGSKPMPGTCSNPRLRKALADAAAGATPWPRTDSIRRSRSLHSSIGTSPPGPLRCGSTTCSTKPPAAAASNALPPRSSTPMAVCEASQWVDATTPKVPVISGRVVKGLIRTGFGNSQCRSSKLSRSRQVA